MAPNVFHDEVFTHLLGAVIIINREGNILYMNPSAERLFRVSSQSARGQKLTSFTQPAKKIQKPLNQVLGSGRVMKIHDMEIKISGFDHVLQVEIAPIGELETPSGAIVWISEMSLTQALRQEDRLRDRLDMMGTLASGLAHEIRNPLGGIRGAAQMLARDPNAPEAKEYSAMVISEVDRINELVSQLLDFAKPKRIKKGPVNIHKILSEILALQKGALDKQDIALVKEFDPSLPAVYGHGPSLRQALLNLIKNAVEAMPKGGTLRVRTHFHSHARVLSGEPLSGSLAEISIQDTGPGISKRHRKSLFTPFFTTKAKGTGLGLMMVQRILKEHQGSLKLESEPQKGACFHLFLKLATA